MRPKIIIMMILLVMLTIMILQIVYSANATTVFGGISKTNMIIAALIVSFILGYMTGYPSRQKRLRHIHHDSDEYEDSDTLSEEDRRYIE